MPQYEYKILNLDGMVAENRKTTGRQYAAHEVILADILNDLGKEGFRIRELFGTYVAERRKEGDTSTAEAPKKKAK